MELRLESNANCARVALVKQNWRPPNWFIQKGAAGILQGPMSSGRALATALPELSPAARRDARAVIAVEDEKDRGRIRLCGATGSSQKITGLVLSPAPSCSAQCDYCYAAPRLLVGEVGGAEQSELLRSTIEFAEAHPGVDPEWCLTIGGGGDPVEHAEFYKEALTICSAMGHDVWISSVEPSFLGLSMAAEIARHQGWITLSVDGSPLVSAIHRPRSDAARFVRSMDGIKWAASGVFTHATVDRLAESFLYLLDSGFDAVQMRPVRLGTGHELALTAHDFEKACLQYRMIIREVIGREDIVGGVGRLTTADCFGRLFFRYLLEMNVLRRCGAGLATIFVGTDGRLFPCSSTTADEFCLGDVWSRSLDVGGAKVHQELWGCSTCRVQPVCGGPCLHDVTLALDDAPPALCEFQRELGDLAIETIQDLYSRRPTALRELIQQHFSLHSPQSALDER